MKHLPHYIADERTRYNVRIQTYRGSVHWVRGCTDLEECQIKFIEQVEDIKSKGIALLVIGDVFDERGQNIARITSLGNLVEPFTHKLLAPRPEVIA